MTFQTDWSGRGVEEYYQKFIELQERLRKSEEERLQLEMKFNTMIQITQEEEQLYFKRLKTQYKRFMEENQKRQERNQQLLTMLERIEGRAAMFEAKSKRFKLLRNQYHSFLNRIENERRLEGLESKKGTEKDSTLSVLIDHQLPKALGGVQIREVRENAKPQWPPDLGTADQLLSRFKEQSNEATIADDILRSIYERNRKRNDLNARRVTIEDDTDDSSTSVAAGDVVYSQKKKMQNGHVPSGKVNSILAQGKTYSSSEVLDEIETINIDEMLNKSKDFESHGLELMENCNGADKNVDVNQNTLQATSSEEHKQVVTENGLDISLRVENKSNGIEDEEITETALQHENFVEDKMATETKEVNLHNKIEQSQQHNQNNYENGTHAKIQLETQLEPVLQHNTAQNNDITEFQQQDEALIENVENVTNGQQQQEYQQYYDGQQNVYQEQNDSNAEQNYQDTNNLEIAETQGPNVQDYPDPNANANLEQEQAYGDTHAENVESAYQDPNDPNVQYDESGQPIQYDANGQQIYYDDNGQAMHYDANTQEYKYNEQQYDENGQPTGTGYDQNYQNYQYDENGQVVDYAAQQGQENVYYDENGQPVAYPQVDQVQDDQVEATQGEIHPVVDAALEQAVLAEPNVYYDENGQAVEYEQPNDQYDQQQQQEGQQDQHGLQLEGSEDPQQMAAHVPVGESAGYIESTPNEQTANVMEFLDTESESTRNKEQEQDSSKAANESDFDFSSTSEVKEHAAAN